MRRSVDTHIKALSGSGQSEAQVLVRLKLAAWLKPTWSDRVIEFFSKIAGNLAFVNFNLAWIAMWIILNLGLIHGVAPFDPFPFSLLMVIIPSEALLLVVLVSLNQHRLRCLADKLARLDSLTDAPEDEDTRGTTWGSKREAASPNSEP